MPEKQRGLLERSGDTCGRWEPGLLLTCTGMRPGCVRVRMCEGGGLESFLGERERRRDDGSSPHKQGEAGGGWGPGDPGTRGPGGSAQPQASVDLATGFECPLGGSAVDLDVGLGPGDDVAGKGLGAAGGQVVHLPRGQLAVPDVEMGQLAHKRLGGIKPATQSVLQRKAEGEGGGGQSSECLSGEPP